MEALLLLLVALPFVAAGVSLYLGERRAVLALRLSLVVALALTALTLSRAVVDVELTLLAGRSLLLSPIAQLGVQLLALSMFGLVLSLEDESPALVAGWLPVAWLSVGGLTLALLVTSLPLAVLAFLGAALLWAFGMSADERAASSAAVMRYVALLALLMPLLMIAFLLAEQRTTATPEIERVVLALAVPAFGLLLGVMPLHGWVLTLASGTPRAMLFGVLGLVQTAGFVLLLRTMATYPWLVEPARGPLIIGGAISMLVGGWLALSSRLDDPDDFLVYAVVANAGILLAGLGAHAAAAGAGVALLLFARVLALVAMAMAHRVEGALRNLAYALVILTLAGTPGLAGFPGMWLVLRRLQEGGNTVVQLAILTGSGLLFATAVRRWRSEPAGSASTEPGAVAARRIVILLIALLVLLGVAPQIIAPAFTGALRGMYFLNP